MKFVTRARSHRNANFEARIVSRQEAMQLEIQVPDIQEGKLSFEPFLDERKWIRATRRELARRAGLESW